MPDEKSQTSPTEVDFPITIGGKAYILSFPMLAYWKLAEETGIDLMRSDPRRATKAGREEITTEYMAKPMVQRMKDTIDLLWAGLLTHQPQLTRTQVHAMVFPRDFAAIEAQVIKGHMASLGIVAPGEESEAEEGSEAEVPLAVSE